jgi:hypothetical protein
VLLDRLRQYWEAQGETALAKLVPYLVALRAELLGGTLTRDAAPKEVSEFVYPLF